MGDMHNPGEGISQRALTSRRIVPNWHPAEVVEEKIDGEGLDTFSYKCHSEGFTQHTKFRIS